MYLHVICKIMLEDPKQFSTNLFSSQGGSELFRFHIIYTETGTGMGTIKYYGLHMKRLSTGLKSSDLSLPCENLTKHFQLH